MAGVAALLALSAYQGSAATPVGVRPAAAGMAARARDQIQGRGVPSRPLAPLGARVIRTPPITIVGTGASLTAAPFEARTIRTSPLQIVGTGQSLTPAPFAARTIKTAPITIVGTGALR